MWEYSSCHMIVPQKNTFTQQTLKNYKMDTRQRNNFYLPQANLTIYKKRAYYLEIKILE
jgi:hypothetical protein